MNKLAQAQPILVGPRFEALRERLGPFEGDGDSVEDPMEWNYPNM
jgi:hypothetical protein